MGRVASQRPSCFRRSMMSWLVALSVTSLPSISGQRVPWKVPSGATGLTNARPYCWAAVRSEEHTSELQSRLHLVCRLLLEKKKKKKEATWKASQDISHYLWRHHT